MLTHVKLSIKGLTDGNTCLITNFKYSLGAIKCVCFSSDGKLFASASYDHTVRVVNSSTGKEVFNLEGMTPNISLSWNLSNNTLRGYVMLMHQHGTS